MPVIQFGEQFRALGPGVLTIGSAPEAGWRIAGCDLEPLHVVLVPERGGRTLLSAGSEHARVTVNGEPLASSSRDLQIGDVIAAGGAEFTFRHHPGAADLTAPAFLRDMRHGRLYRLSTEATTAIGRDPSCLVLLREPEVSRSHAEVRAGGDSGYELAPTGGVTLLNGQRITAAAPLREGDEVTVGRTQLRFSRQVPQHLHVDAGNRSSADVKSARLQTMFVGAMESRDYEARRNRRKMGRLAVIAGAIVVLAGLLVTRFTGLGNAAAGTPAASDVAASAPVASPAVAAPLPAADSVVWPVAAPIESFEAQQEPAPAPRSTRRARRTQPPAPAAAAVVAPVPDSGAMSAPVAPVASDSIPTP